MRITIALMNPFLHQARFVGFHWFNPPVVSRLIEIVQLPNVTSVDAIAQLVALTRRVQKVSFTLLHGLIFHC